MTKEKLQEKYILYQLLSQNLEGLKQQLQLVEQQLIEVKSTALSIEDLNDMGEKNEIFLNLGSGCYGKGKITENNELLVNAGAGIFIKQKAASTKSFLDERAKDLEKGGDEIQAQMERVVKQINEIGLEIQEMAQEEKS